VLGPEVVLTASTSPTSSAASVSFAPNIRAFGSFSSAWGRSTSGCGVACGDRGLGLRADGSIVAWGRKTDWAGNYTGQCDVPTPNSDFVAVAADADYRAGACTCLCHPARTGATPRQAVTPADSTPGTPSLRSRTSLDRANPFARADGSSTTASPPGPPRTRAEPD